MSAVRIGRTAGIAVIALALAAAASAQAPECVTPWTSLSLVAKKGIMKARVDLSVEPTTGGAAAADLVTCPAGDGRNPAGDCLMVIDATTDASFSAPVRTRTWLDPSRGILQVETWDGKIHRRSRECASGRHTWRWQRKGSKEEFVRERHRDAPAGGSSLPVVDALSLLWIASAQRLDKEGSSIMAAAWSHDTLLPIRLEAKERAMLPPREGEGEGVAARRVEIAVAEEADEADAASATPFGMTGPVSLWLAEGTGLPLILEGKSAKAGRIRAVNVDAGVR